MLNPKVQVYGNVAILSYNYMGMTKDKDGKTTPNRAKSTRVSSYYPRINAHPGQQRSGFCWGVSRGARSSAAVGSQVWVARVSRS
jgi:hypothetical protein